MTRLACAASLGLIVTTAPLGLFALQTNAEAAPQVTLRSEDDRGSGRFSRVPAIADLLSFRGSGRIDPNAPFQRSGWHAPVAYRGSGRITNARAT
ncbi:MAG: hypothetical protein ACFCVB_01630 [Nodosilinea sp.]